jgi:hypothetical protein
VRAGWSLDAIVRLAPDGIDITAHGEHVARGCNEGGGDERTVRGAGGDYDYQALAACLKKLKGLSPEARAERVIDVRADGAVPLETLIRTMEVIRTNDEGDLFPDVRLGAPEMP